jgi:hypothetical protein
MQQWLLPRVEYRQALSDLVAVIRNGAVLDTAWRVPMNLLTDLRYDSLREIRVAWRQQLADDQ